MITISEKNSLGYIHYTMNVPMKTKEEAEQLLAFVQSITNLCSEKFPVYERATPHVYHDDSFDEERKFRAVFRFSIGIDGNVPPGKIIASKRYDDEDVVVGFGLGKKNEIQK